MVAVRVGLLEKVTFHAKTEEGEGGTHAGGPGGRAFQAERLAKEHVWDVCVCPVWQNEREEAAASEAGEE